MNRKLFSQIIIFVIFIGSFLNFQSAPAIAVSSNPAAVCSGATCTITFPFTGDYYAWATPLTGTFTLEVWGAQGGVRSGGGGLGGYSKGSVSLNSATTLYIYPGGAGAYISGASAGGFNGGGTAAGGGEQQGGGGGATHIATSVGLLSTLSGNTSSVLIVAGGGGGSDDGSSGGSGGGTAGTDGTDNPSYAATAEFGKGGTASAAGCANTKTGISCGSFGQGGRGDNVYGSGGGGGWYGGGGGWYDSGGGGGSGYIAASLSSTTSSTGVRSGAGLAVITYPNGPMVNGFTTPSSITNSSTFTYTLSFSESVSGLASNDFVLSGSGSSTCILNITGSTSVYSINLSNCAQGTVQLTLSANSVSNTSSQTGPSSTVSASLVTVDQISPIVSSVTPPGNGTYKPADTPTFTVAFSESVTVTGTPRLVLIVGSVTEYANYISQTDSRTALFRYTVLSDITEFDTDGISLSTTLDLNGGSISDLATNALSPLTFTAPNTSNIFVAQPPAAPIIDSATAGSGFISIFFRPGATYGSAITNYQFSTNNGGAWTTRSPVDTSSPLTISGLTNGTSYTVRLRAVSAVGNSDSSTSITATPNAVTVSGGSNISTTYGVSASSSSFTSTGGVSPYVYTLSTNIPGISISNGVVTTSSTLNAGTYSLNVVSTDSFLANGTRAITVTVAKARQETVTITSTSGSFNGVGSRLPMMFRGGTDTGTVTYSIAAGGTATGCSVDGTTLVVNSTGTCRVVATKATTTNYLIAFSDTATITFSQFISYQPVQTQSVPTQIPINGQNFLDTSQQLTVPAITGVFLVGSTYEINGTGFSEVVRVMIGGTEATISSSSANKIVISSADLMPGPLFIECSDGRIGPSPWYFFTP